MPDAYDQAIEFFTQYPKKILLAWSFPFDSDFGYLFRYLTPSGNVEHLPGGRMCGCPTQVKSCDRVAYNDELTAAVTIDVRIPKDPKDLAELSSDSQISALSAIADIQRLADQMLNRMPPVTPYPVS